MTGRPDRPGPASGPAAAAAGPSEAEAESKAEAGVKAEAGADAPGPILRLRGVVKTRPGGAGYRLTVGRLRIGPKERVALIGDSGSGKSTLLDIIALVLKPAGADELSFRPSEEAPWEDLWRGWSTGRHRRFESIRRSHLGYVLQTGGLLPFLTVRDNIALPADLKSGRRTRETEEYLAYLADELKIAHLLRKHPARISVGERQRCAIARALIHRPALVLADEPTASLDPPTADRVFELLLGLCVDCALVVSTHEHRRVVGTGGFRVHRIDCGQASPSDPIEAVVVEPEEPGAAPGRPDLAKAGAAGPVAAGAGTSGAEAAEAGAV